MEKVHIPGRMNKIPNSTYYLDMDILTFYCDQTMQWANCKNRGFKQIGCCCWSCSYSMIVAKNAINGNEHVVKGRKETIVLSKEDSAQIKNLADIA